MKTLCWFWCVASLAVVLASGCRNLPAPEEVAAPSPTSAPLEVGQMGHLISKKAGLAVPVALSRDDLEEFGKAERAGNAISQRNLVNAGKVFVADSGAQVKVITAEEGNVRVRVMTGRHAQEEGWVSSDTLLSE